MILNPILFLSNRGGIPRISSSSVSVGTSAVTFTVPSIPTFSNAYNGLILLKMEQEIPSGTTTTLPIELTSTMGGTRTVTTLGGADWTVANYQTGIHLAYFESNTGTLQILI